MPHLRKSWLQSTSTSVLDKSLDQTKVEILCCYEPVSYQVRREEVKYSDSLKDIHLTGGEVSSEFPKFHGMWLPSESYSTLQIELCHSSKIQSSYGVIVLCVLVRGFRYCLIPYIRVTCFRITSLQISYLRRVLASVYERPSFIKVLKGYI